MSAMKKNSEAGTTERLAAKVAEAGTDRKDKFAGLTEKQLLAVYKMMLTSRRMDEKMLILLKQGKVFFHIGGPGHEAIQIACAFALRPGHDWAYPYYRDLAFALQLGETAEEVLMNSMHRAADPSTGGRQAPGHYGHQ